MRFTRILLVLMGSSCLFSFSKTNAPVLNYIDKYSPIAVQEMERTGIPASITLAQGIIESRYGTSGLSKNSNNHFGIKCNNNWQGEGYYYKDDDYVNGKLVKSCFRVYTTPEASFYDHSEFLMVNSRYQSLFRLKKTDYKGWAKGLKKAGYATAKDYATSLIKTIEKYQLHKYDRKQVDLLVQFNPPVPKAERIPENLDLVTPSKPTNIPMTTNSEILVAVAPPQVTKLPDNYKIGDGLKTNINTTNEQKPSFHDLVYGKSSRYLEVIEGN